MWWVFLAVGVVLVGGGAVAVIFLEGFTGFRHVLELRPLSDDPDSLKRSQARLYLLAGLLTLVPTLAVGIIGTV